MVLDLQVTHFCKKAKIYSLFISDKLWKNLNGFRRFYDMVILKKEATAGGFRD
jgi:hypothetical protein